MMKLDRRNHLSLVCLTAAFALVSASLCQPAPADVLQGGVQENDEIMRLNRANQQGAGNNSTGDPLRIQRPMVAPNFRSGGGLTGVVDTAAFSTPLQGNAQDNGVHLGLLQPQQFGNIPNSKFDLGAERGDRQLTLAWEAWHHQLSQAIYSRWSEVAAIPGQATMRITVTRDRQIKPMILQGSGRPAFDRALMDAVMSLNGNPGLTFPSKSQRQEVSFEADYIASTHVQPGFSWVKNDYEKVHEGY
jgi:hypothetical protein